MWKFAVACMALVMFSAPALAQSNPRCSPGQEQNQQGQCSCPSGQEQNQQGQCVLGLDAGTILLVAAGVGLAGFVIYEVTRKSVSP
jgi:hypothetical protein